MEELLPNKPSMSNPIASNKVTVNCIPQAGKVEIIFHMNQSVDFY